MAPTFCLRRVFCTPAMTAPTTVVWSMALPVFWRASLGWYVGCWSAMAGGMAVGISSGALYIDVPVVEVGSGMAWRASPDSPRAWPACIIAAMHVFEWSEWSRAVKARRAGRPTFCCSRYGSCWCARAFSSPTYTYLHHNLSERLLPAPARNCLPPAILDTPSRRLSASHFTSPLFSTARAKPTPYAPL